MLLTDRMDRLTKTVQDLADAQKGTDARLNTLITIVDGVIRRPPLQSGA